MNGSCHLAFGWLSAKDIWYYMEKMKEGFCYHSPPPRDYDLDAGLSNDRSPTAPAVIKDEKHLPVA